MTLVDQPPLAAPALRRPLPEAPPPELVYHHSVSLVQGLREGWRSRLLVSTLAERQLRTRYKQAFLGFLWAVIKPLVLMVAFTVVFGRIADVETGGAPYVLFSFIGVIAWDFTSTALDQGSLSLINSLPLLNKIACPREVFPLSYMAVAGVDALLSATCLAVLFGVTGTMPEITTFWVLLILPVHVIVTAAVTMGAAILVVYLRDLRYALPLLLQFGLLITPVAYGLDTLPSQWRLPSVIVNPVAGVIDGYRQVMLFGEAPGRYFFAAAGSAVAMFLVAYWLFKRLEIWITDVA